MNKQIIRRNRKNVPRFDDEVNSEQNKGKQDDQQKQNIEQLNQFLEQVKNETTQNQSQKIDKLEDKFNLICQKFKKLNEEDRQNISTKKQSIDDRSIEMLNETYDILNPNDYNEMKQYIKRKKIITELKQDSQQNEKYSIDSQMEQKVMKMMHKQGWSIGTGLGKNKQGIKTPLLMLKTNSSQAVIVEQSEGVRSRVILLKNMVEWEQDYDLLRKEVEQECQKFGKIEDLVIYQDMTQGSVRVFVLYSNSKEAQEAYRQLNNRYFGGRMIICEYYDENQFMEKNLTL